MTSGAQAFVQGAFGALQDGKPAIAMQPVKSTNIAALGFDVPSSTLEVHFASGQRYRYSGVPEAEFQALLTSDSKGAHFASKVRGRYPGKKVEPPKAPEKDAQQ